MKREIQPIAIVVGLAVLLLLPVGSPSAQAAGKTAVRDPSPCDAACEVDKFINLNIGLTQRPTTLDRLRRMAKLQSDTEKPSEGGATLHELTFPGLVLRVYSPSLGAAIIEGITVTGGEHDLPFGLQLDSSPRDIQTLLGPPTETSPNPPDQVRWIYRDSGRTSSVTFDIEKDAAIKSVDWNFTGDYVISPKAKTQ